MQWRYQICSGKIHPCPSRYGSGGYGHIIDEDGWKIAKMREDDFYSKENLNLNISGSGKKTNMFLAPEGVDTELQTKIFAKPEVVVSLSSLVKTIK